MVWNEGIIRILTYIAVNVYTNNFVLDYIVSVGWFWCQMENMMWKLCVLWWISIVKLIIDARAIAFLTETYIDCNCNNELQLLAFNSFLTTLVIDMIVYSCRLYGQCQYGEKLIQMIRVCILIIEFEMIWKCKTFARIVINWCRRAFSTQMSNAEQIHRYFIGGMRQPLILIVVILTNIDIIRHNDNDQWKMILITC